MQNLYKLNISIGLKSLILEVKRFFFHFSNGIKNVSLFGVLFVPIISEVPRKKKDFYYCTFSFFAFLCFATFNLITTLSRKKIKIFILHFDFVFKLCDKCRRVCFLFSYTFPNFHKRECKKIWSFIFFSLLKFK